MKVEQLEREARKELLAIKEVMANKQADFEQTIGAKEKQLLEATMRFQSAEAEILRLQSQGKPRTEEFEVELKEVEVQLQDALQDWKDDILVCEDRFSDYQNGVTKQMEIKDGQIEELYSKLNQIQESNELSLYRVVGAEKQKWEVREARLIAQLDKATEQIVALPKHEKVGTKQQQLLPRAEESAFRASISSHHASHTPI